MIGCFHFHACLQSILYIAYDKWKLQKAVSAFYRTIYECFREAPPVKSDNLINTVR